MTRLYRYIIKGRDGEGEAFEISSSAQCEYAQVWETANMATVQRLIRLGYACPISIESVTITRDTETP